MPGRKVTPAYWLRPQARWSHLVSLLGEGWDFRLRECSIYRNADQSPVRQIPTPSAMRFEGEIQSVKNLGRCSWEAEHERLFMLHSEVSSEVIRYWPQPMEIRMSWVAKVGGVTTEKSATYFPDLERQMADGRRQVVETKSGYSDVVGDLEYVEKLLVANTTLTRFGHEFLLVSSEEDLSDRNVNRSINSVYLDRFAQLTTTDKLLLANHMSRNNELRSTYAEVCCAFTGWPAPDKVHAAFVRRIIAYDSSEPLIPESVVWVPGPSKKELPRPNSLQPAMQVAGRNQGFGSW